MTNGGYILLDFGGLDLDDSTEQTIEGIYARAKEALSMNKPIIAVNCVMTNTPCTPCPIFARQSDEDTIIALGPMIGITIEEDDGVTVSNYIV